MPADVKGIVCKTFPTDADETILDYVVAVIDDEHFEWGKDGEGAYDSIGEILVSSGCCPDDASAMEACRQLASQLAVHQGPKTSSTRALDSGPVSLEEVDGRDLLYQAENVKHMIQTPFGNLPEISDKDKLKMEKKMQKEEAMQRAALAAHQARAKSSAKGDKPIIMRNAGSYGAKDLHLENFSVSNGGKDLISEATITLAYGRRYGIIGRNGTGKTTLLRAMAHHELPGIPKNCQILHVEQEVAGDDTAVIDMVLECDCERAQLLKEEAKLLKELNMDKPAGSGAVPATAPATDAPAANLGAAAADKESAASARLQQVYNRLLEIDADGAKARAAVILSGLSFDAHMMQRPTRTFSGGWRMRIALACALFVEPDLLLLDEPTNHLDLHAVLWLEDYLLKWPKTLIIVSHAREFLNVVCTDIIHLHAFKLTMYRGNFDTFEKTMTERVKNAKKAAEAQDMKRKHVQNFIDKFRYNAKRASLVQSRIKALERMAEVELDDEDAEYIFRFPTPDGGAAPPIVSFQDVDFAYPGGPTLFKGLNFGLDLESRLAIVGSNGIGKSTLLNLIAGRLEPTKGVITRNPKVRMATFSQHHVDGLDLALSPLQIMMKSFPMVKEQELRAHLGSFGVSGPLALQPIYTCSGGQKSRVAFAKLTYTKPHILLLDEPSNHLDIDAVDALIIGLASYGGGVLMVSHDQYLIESSVDELWICDGGAVTSYHDSFEEYKKKLRASDK